MNFTCITIVMLLANSVVMGQNTPSFDNQCITKETPMESYSVIQKPSMIIVGIECRTSNAPEAAPKDIPQHWGKFYSENVVSRIPNKVSDEVIALYCDYEGDYTQPYSLVIGSPVSSLEEVPAGMVAKILPESAYAVFHSVGEQPQAIIATWGEIWQTDLDRTYTGDFEVYGDKFINGEVDVFIAVNP